MDELVRRTVKQVLIPDSGSWRPCFAGQGVDASTARAARSDG